MRRYTGGLSVLHYLRQGGYVIVVVCLSVRLLAALRKNFQTSLHQTFREGWQWANEQMIKFWWRSGSPSGYRDSFPDSSLLGDTESDINDCAAQHCSAGHALAGIAIATMTSL